MCFLSRCQATHASPACFLDTLLRKSVQRQENKVACTRTNALMPAAQFHLAVCGVSLFHVEVLTLYTWPEHTFVCSRLQSQLLKLPLRSSDHAQHLRLPRACSRERCRQQKQERGTAHSSHRTIWKHVHLWKMPNFSCTKMGNITSHRVSFAIKKDHMSTEENVKGSSTRGRDCPFVFSACCIMNESTSLFGGNSVCVSCSGSFSSASIRK